MSALFYQNAVPQENQSIKCNDITVRGSVVANEIILPAMTVYTQLTSQTTAVSVANGDQQFIVDTFTGASIPGGSSITFAINNPSIVLNKTIVVMNKMGSVAALTEVNDFVSVTAAGGMTITRHNFGATAATGLQRLCFKLIQTT
jgi:hypothetical protein